MKRGADGAISLDVTSQIRVRSGKPRRALVLKGLKGLKDKLSWDRYGLGFPMKPVEGLCIFSVIGDIILPFFLRENLTQACHCMSI